MNEGDLLEVIKHMEEHIQVPSYAMIKTKSSGQQ